MDGDGGAPGGRNTQSEPMAGAIRRRNRRNCRARWHGLGGRHRRFFLVVFWPIFRMKPKNKHNKTTKRRAIGMPPPCHLNSDAVTSISRGAGRIFQCQSPPPTSNDPASLIDRHGGGGGGGSASVFAFAPPSVFG